MLSRLFIVGLAAVALATAAVVVIRHSKVVKVADDISIVRLPDDVIVVVGPQQQIRISKPKEPKEPRTRKPSPGQPLDIRSPAQRGVWTLPYTCSDVRYYASHFTPAQLEAMRVAMGMRAPTAAERKQIQDCIAGRIK